MSTRSRETFLESRAHPVHRADNLASIACYRDSFTFTFDGKRLILPAGPVSGIPQFRDSVSVTPYLMAISEARCSDRCGVTPQHIPYMVMKILHLFVKEGVYNTFCCFHSTKDIKSV
jgi:hypothetical protein